MTTVNDLWVFGKANKLTAKQISWFNEAYRRFMIRDSQDLTIESWVSIGWAGIGTPAQARCVQEYFYPLHVFPCNLQGKRGIYEWYGLTPKGQQLMISLIQKCPPPPYEMGAFTYYENFLTRLFQ